MVRQDAAVVQRAMPRSRYSRRSSSGRWESDPDSPYVLGLTLNALAFISDAVGHAHIAGGDPSAIDGNVLQKGHARGDRRYR